MTNSDKYNAVIDGFAELCKANGLTDEQLLKASGAITAFTMEKMGARSLSTANGKLTIADSIAIAPGAKGSLRYTVNKSLKDVVSDGFERMQKEGCKGFEYTIGKVRGGSLDITFSPHNGDYESVCIDGVNGFGYCLVFEE